MRESRQEWEANAPSAQSVLDCGKEAVKKGDLRGFAACDGMTGVSRDAGRVPEQVVTLEDGDRGSGSSEGGGDRPGLEQRNGGRRTGIETAEMCNKPPKRTDSAVEQVPDVVHNVALGFHKAEKLGGGSKWRRRDIIVGQDSAGTSCRSGVSPGFGLETRDRMETETE